MVPSRLAEPPPIVDLSDGDVVVGWMEDDAFGFHGFADAVEAVHAAWVAYRTMERRRARTEGRRPPPVDAEPLALAGAAEPTTILAGGRPIGVLVRCGARGRGVPDSFGFELRVPPPADEVRVRSMAHLVYRTLRRSGLRWALWARPAPSASARARPAAAPEARGARSARVRRTPAVPAMAVPGPGTGGAA
jgi:hypothetical protein